MRLTDDDALSSRSSVELAADAWRHFESRMANTIAFDVDSRDLHDLRIRTKEASKLTWILERVFPEVHLETTLKDLLDDLQNQLGRWHDFDVAVVWAEKVPSDEVPEGTRRNWESFLHTLRRKRGVLRAKVMRRWSLLCNRSPGSD